eukprot:CAMPEP_0172042688 /NCGR_PEP_ID=MMETSP1041-20130122/25831_1 /TAXON_ID=464988 /ORGANISM="Hemiselmis andersenii, Strain CCMP439" /LENGTH=66 /DNA_ID=CAMNT_0012701001 /DNA_START=1 /DNA_END=198 /DNA_ORIENTATION=+
MQSLLESRWWDPPEMADVDANSLPQDDVSGGVRHIDEHALALPDVLRSMAASSHQSVESAIDNLSN